MTFFTVISQSFWPQVSSKFVKHLTAWVNCFCWDVFIHKGMKEENSHLLLQEMMFPDQEYLIQFFWMTPWKRYVLITLLLQTIYSWNQKMTFIFIRGYTGPHYEPLRPSVSHFDLLWSTMIKNILTVSHYDSLWATSIPNLVNCFLLTQIKVVWPYPILVPKTPFFGQIWFCKKSLVQCGFQGCWFWNQQYFSQILSPKYLIYVTLVQKLQSALV